MLSYKNMVALSQQKGFSHVAPLDIATIKLKQEVRQMCEVNTCGQYGKRWSCPPGCGTLKECQANLPRYKEGILVQTVGCLEDSLDGEGMMRTREQHKNSFRSMYESLQEKHLDVLAIGAGACEVCENCTYPDAPCRFPDKKISSMEAYGMMVLEVCKENGLGYYYGPNTIAFTSCFLW